MQTGRAPLTERETEATLSPIRESVVVSWPPNPGNRMELSQQTVVAASSSPSPSADLHHPTLAPSVPASITLPPSYKTPASVGQLVEQLKVVDENVASSAATTHAVVGSFLMCVVVMIVS